MYKHLHVASPPFTNKQQLKARSIQTRAPRKNNKIKTFFQSNNTEQLGRSSRSERAWKLPIKKNNCLDSVLGVGKLFFFLSIILLLREKNKKKKTSWTWVKNHVFDSSKIRRKERRSELLVVGCAVSLGGGGVDEKEVVGCGVWLNRAITTPEGDDVFEWLVSHQTKSKEKRVLGGRDSSSSSSPFFLVIWMQILQKLEKKKRAKTLWMCRSGGRTGCKLSARLFNTEKKKILSRLSKYSNKFFFFFVAHFLLLLF